MERNEKDAGIAVLILTNRLRMKRVHERFGEGIEVCGDMYEEYQKMLNDIAGCDYGIGGCALQTYKSRLKSLQ